MLSYYVEWHLRQRLAPMLFTDTARDSSTRKSAVAAAQRSAAAERKARTKRTPEGTKAMSYASLMAHLRALCRYTITPKLALKEVCSIPKLGEPTSTQLRAFELLGVKLK